MWFKGASSKYFGNFPRQDTLEKYMQRITLK